MLLNASPSVLPPAEQGFEQTLIMLAIAAFFFYFILWRPEQKRKKKLEASRAGLKKGDRVMVAGIVGEVSKVQEDTVIIKMVEGAKIEVLKAAILDVQSKQDAAPEAEKEGG